MAKKTKKELMYAIKKKKNKEKVLLKQYEQKKDIFERTQTDEKEMEKIAYIVRDKASSKEIYDACKMNFLMHKNKELSKSSSRMTLNEVKGQFLCCEGLVSDIRLLGKGGAMLLLDNPKILKDGNSKFTEIDSHIWLFTRDIMGIYDRTSVLTVSIGDTLMFYSRPYEYKGKGDYGVRTYKYGLKDIVFVKSGFLNVTNLRYNTWSLQDFSDCILKYNRKGEWVLRLHPNGKLETKIKPEWAEKVVDSETQKLFLEKVEKELKDYEEQLR